MPPQDEGKPAPAKQSKRPRRRNNRKKNPNPKPAPTVTHASTSIDFDASNPAFDDLPIAPTFKSNLKAMGLVRTTDIQSRSFEHIKSGRDVLGRARTGTGKTVSFLLPSLDRLLKSSSQSAVDMLILSPTRELANQIAVQVEALVQNTKLSHQVIFGGTNRDTDVRKFNRKVPNVLVATPGRLQDHMNGTTVRGKPFNDLLQAQIVVLDETDRLLDMGFRREVEAIISKLPAERQTLLFSATVPPDVKQVMEASMKPGFAVVDCIQEDDSNAHTNAQVAQSHVLIDSNTRWASGIVDIISKIAKEQAKVVVFFNTANLVAFFAVALRQLKISVMEIHSRKSQSYRTRTAEQFRQASSAILLTSDVSARGVDYPGVKYVLQVGIADSRESYIHRLGRTGRAGNDGEGLLVLTDVERKFLDILNLDIPTNKEFQELVDGPAQLSPIDVMRSSELRSDGEKAYRSMLGFYNGKLRKIGVPGQATMVEFVNRFASQIGFEEMPNLELKTAKKMGLNNVPGLNIVSRRPNEGSSRPQKKGRPRGNSGGGRGGW